MNNDSDWYPSRRADQRAMYGNFLTKIDGHKAAIGGLTTAMADRLKLICETFIEVFDKTAMNDATMSELHRWQQDLERGAMADAVQPPPVFQTITLPAGAFKGFVKEFRDKIGLLKKMEGYTDAIGADLMIIAAKQTDGGIQNQPLKPDLEFKSLSGYRVSVAGKMRGMQALKIFYRRKGTVDWVFVGFLTRLPGEVHIPPAQDGTPEIGDVRGKFNDNNQDAGEFSANHEVTLS